MPEFIGIYGFEITQSIQVAEFAIQPCFIQPNEVKAYADDQRQFILTAVGELQGTANESSFDLAAAMTFCQ